MRLRHELIKLVKATEHKLAARMSICSKDELREIKLLMENERPEVQQTFVRIMQMD